MKKYLIKHINGNLVARCNSREEAGNTLIEYITTFNEESEDDYLTPFDFKLEEVEVKGINFETAREYLGIVPNEGFVVKQNFAYSCNGIKIEDATRLVQELNPKHVEALIALNELFTIAEAWNKEDGFVPDFSNRNQWKYFPWFTYNNDAAGFVFAATTYTAMYAHAGICSRLCFKTEKRARQFGEQFIDLWNKVLLISERR